MTDEEAEKILTLHRKAVRRDYFRRMAIAKKLVTLLSRPGVFTDPDRGGRDGERSVAGTDQRTIGGQSHPPHTGAKLTISSRKTMPERDGENMGQIDYLSSSSGCDMPTGITTADQAAQPGQEQKPALTDRKDE